MRVRSSSCDFTPALSFKPEPAFTLIFPHSDSRINPPALVGSGIISDTDAQPIVINSHLGKFAIVTVAKINNLDELEDELLKANMHFSELSSGKTNRGIGLGKWVRDIFLESI